MILTIKATAEISARYGSVETLNEKLKHPNHPDLPLDEIIWLITLLANQAFLIDKFKTNCMMGKRVSEGEMELFVSPQNLEYYKETIAEAISKATGDALGESGS